MAKLQTLPLFDEETFPLYNLYNPLPMQYLGSKSRISQWILEQIQHEFPDTNTFVDLFAGTGALSIGAKDQSYKIIANDVQPYSSGVLKSLFQESRTGLDEIIIDITRIAKDDYLLSSGRSEARKLLYTERSIFESSKSKSWQWKDYKDFCDETKLTTGSKDDIKKLKSRNAWNLFINYYANTYFGVEQCLQIDSLREYAQNLDAAHNRAHILAATITAMTFAVSSTTHLAQYLKPSSREKSLNLIKRRSYNIVAEVQRRLKNLSSFPLPDQPAEIYQLDFRELLDQVRPNSFAIVYADPPYFKEHYSRYYHVLDTFYLYDYPELTYNERINQTTVGRYRKERTVSDFGLKSSVQEAFDSLFEKISAYDTKIALSYASTSLIGKDQLVHIANRHNLKGEVKEISLMHSGQGQPRHKNVKEYLFLFSK